MKIWVPIACLMLVAAGCGTKDYPSVEESPAPVKAAAPEVQPVELTAEQLAAAGRAGADPEIIARLEAMPLYEFQPEDVHAYLGYLQELKPDLRERVGHLARKNLGQPYEIYLLGEFPFETYDAQPLYCLDKSDCVVFSEHTYAMALTHDWPSFFAMLQRIRYKDGQIGVATRNHFTEADWDINNEWLIEDITEELAGEDTFRFETKFDRAKMLKKRWDLDVDIPVEEREITFVPFEKVGEVASQLHEGDFVNVMRGRNGGYWAGHVGLITVSEDGTRNFLHSTPPQVREEPLAEYIRRNAEAIAEREAEGKARLYGFKFFRLRDDPLTNLRAIDGPDAPRVQAPDGSRVFAGSQ